MIYLCVLSLNTFYKFVDKGPIWLVLLIIYFLKFLTLHLCNNTHSLSSVFFLCDWRVNFIVCLAWHFIWRWDWRHVPVLSFHQRTFLPSFICSAAVHLFQVLVSTWLLPFSYLCHPTPNPSTLSDVSGVFCFSLLQLIVNIKKFWGNGMYTHLFFILKIQ